MSRSAEVGSTVAVPSFFGSWPAHSETKEAADRLKTKLRPWGPEGSFKELAKMLDDLLSADDWMFRLPRNRRKVIEALNKISAALDLLPDAAHYEGSREQFITQINEAFKAQAEIAKEMGARLPNLTGQLNRRHAGGLAVFVVAVVAFLAVNWFWPGAPFWFRTSIAVGAAAGSLVSSRLTDFYSIAGYTDKQLNAFAEAVKNMITNKEKAEMWQDVLAGRRENAEMRNDVVAVQKQVAELNAKQDQQIAALREENAEIKAQLNTQNALLQQVLQRLLQPHPCAMPANHASPANDGARKVGNYS